VTTGGLELSEVQRDRVSSLPPSIFATYVVPPPPPVAASAEQFNCSVAQRV
jgi:hypothetical protein